MSLFKKLFFILSVVFFLMIVLLFSQRNSQLVDIDFYIYRFQSIYLWTVICLSFLLGSFFTVVYSFFEVFNVNLKLRRMNKENRVLREEVAALRAQTIDDEEIAHASPQIGNTADAAGTGE